MKVLIVAKTHMHKMACVGGLALDDNHGVRLLQPDSSNQPGDTDYEVGQIWNLQCTPRKDIKPPHVEDVLVTGRTLIGRESDMHACLMSRVHPWRGAPGNTFESLVRPTYQGHGYINDIMGVPSMSTGFWQPDRPLTKEVTSKVYYRYPAKQGVRLLPYVGYAPPIDAIPAGTLVRLSLARWWRQEDSELEERCYLQLSGWYL